jgi:transposase
MANKRIRMNKLRDIIRLKASGSSNQSISRQLRLSRTTLIRYLKQVQACGQSYQQLLALSEAELSAIVSPAVVHAPHTDASRYRVLSDLFEYLEKELRRNGVTRRLLWEEYLKKNPEGYQYTQFCYHFNQWQQSRKVHMHLEHLAGEKLFVDFTGKKLSITDPKSGQLTEVEVLVCVLGGSQYTYVEALPSQKKAFLIKGIENALRYFGGVPRAVVPDNLKAAVTRASRYEPLLNETFEDFAHHYGIAVLPARPAKPCDKSLVEGAVNLAYQRIFAPLRNQMFFSLEQLNEAIHSLLAVYNQTRFQNRSYSRKDLFEQVEKSTLQALPVESYQIREYSCARVQKNSHVLLSADKHYYSVPFRYVGHKVKLSCNEQLVEIYSGYERIAVHERNYRQHGYSTQAHHLPSTHRFVAEWNVERFEQWAAKVGPQTKSFVSALLKSKKHPEQGYKACLGVLQLEKKVGKDRLEKACQRALHYHNYSYRTVLGILDKHLDSVESDQEDTPVIPLHPNIRGQAYYQ